MKNIWGVENNFEFELKFMFINKFGIHNFGFANYFGLKYVTKSNSTSVVKEG